ncbi:hypothetical protein BDB01DRAFT_406684 [Pilobolus umbonatus]|nr:hypothetical protein BDB01DRAFT_406684 [Pilobolus umbonatus]
MLVLWLLPLFVSVECTKYVYPAIATATFTGPSIVGSFNFYQDIEGHVRITGAIHTGLEQDIDYKFRFHHGTCSDMGPVKLIHPLNSMNVYGVGTPPIQEIIEGIQLTGHDGIIGFPWVLMNNDRDLACVIIKGQQQ